MLGLFRYVLALMVAIGHIWPGYLFMSGAYAVFCFYLISGYLMSFILNEVYVRRADAGRYLANRFFRIYPPYLIVLVATAALVLMFPEVMPMKTSPHLSFESLFVVPGDWAAWLGNVTLLFPWDEKLLISQGWSLRVELVFYVLMIFLVRDRRIVLAWLLISVVIIAYFHWTDVPYLKRYQSVGGSSIAFALGAAIYHFARDIRLPAFHLFVSCSIFLAHVAFSKYLWRPASLSADDPASLLMVYQPETFGLYVNLLLGAYVLIAILARQKAQGELFEFGKKMGDVAYAIFLVHWLAAYLAVVLGVPPGETVAYFVVTMGLAHILSFAVFKGVEDPLNTSVRDRIRPVGTGS